MKYLLFILLFTVTATNAQNYVPDSSFNANGRKIYTVYGSNVERSFDVAAQPDGKIVVAGLAKNPASGFFELCFMRFLADGSFDATFGVNGVRKVPMGNQGSIGGQTPKLMIDGAGRIIGANTGYTPGGSQDIFVCRLDSGGNLDNTFNGTGYNFIDMTGSNSWPDIANAMTMDASGNIWLAGATRNGGTPLNNEFAVAKIKPDGTLDTSFDLDGKKLFNATGTSEFGRGIAVKQDGKIVVGGNAQGGMYLISFDSTGAYDTGFNGTGQLALNISGGDMYDLKIDSLGRIIVVGISNSQVALARILPNGTYDTTFNGTGTKVYSPGLAANTVAEVNLVNGVDLMIAGSVNRIGFGYDFFVAKVLENGNAYLTFNTTGSAINTVAAGAVNDECGGIALLSDGRIALAGTANTSSAINEDMSVLMLKVSPFTTGINQSVENGFAFVYPNPAHDFLNIVVEKAMPVEICNVNGQVLSKLNLVNGLNRTDICEYAKGVYLVRYPSSGACIQFVKN